MPFKNTTIDTSGKAMWTINHMWGRSVNLLYKPQKKADFDPSDRWILTDSDETWYSPGPRPQDNFGHGTFISFVSL